MNEQIRRLADKIWAEEYWNNPNTDKLLPAQLNKFALLIVRECAKVCEKQVAGAVGTYAGVHNNAVGACIKGIKEHFEVE